jgi:hypothetical protein
LDLPIDPSIKHFHAGALIGLSRASGLYPECIVLKDIQFTGGRAVAAGGFGEVWKGLCQSQEIAVKVLKVFESSDMTKLLKVSDNDQTISGRRQFNGYGLRSSRAKRSSGDNFDIPMFCRSLVFFTLMSIDRGFVLCRHGWIMATSFNFCELLRLTASFL